MTQHSSPCSSLQIQSNLGKIILKEELEKSAAPLRRKTRSLPDRSQHAGTVKPSRSSELMSSNRLRPLRLQQLRDQTSAHLSSSAGSNASRSVYFPASSKTGLSRVSAAEHNRPITAEFDDDDAEGTCVCLFSAAVGRVQLVGENSCRYDVTSLLTSPAASVTKYFYSSTVCSYSCEVLYSSISIK